MNETIYGNLIARFTKNGELSAAQQAELDGIKGVGDISPNSTFWLHFLPMYLLMARRDEVNLNTIVLLEAIQGSGGGRRSIGSLDLDALAEGVAIRLEDQLPNRDPAVFAKVIARSALPAIQQAVENATAAAVQQPRVELAPLQSVIRETLQQSQASIRDVSRDAMLNRNIVIVTLAGVLMCGIGVWWGGHQADQQWRPVVSELQDQLKQLQGQEHSGRRHRRVAD